MNARVAIGLFAVAAVLAAGADARGEVRTYTLDPNASTLQMSGTIAGIPAGPQTPGSDTTRYSGSLLADVTATTIQFLDGGAMDAQTQPLAQQPTARGTSFNPPAPADYGFTADQPFSPARVALRDLVLDITSDVLTRTGNSIPSGQRVSVDGGVIDYRFEGLNNAEGRDSASTFNFNDAGPGTLTTVGNIETLTIPISARLFFSTIDRDDSILTATGQIVATRVIPEPGSASLFAGLAMMLACRRRR